MLTAHNRQVYLGAMQRIARLAGDAIMEVYDSGSTAVEYKADDSPLTMADRAANAVIVAELATLAGYPIVSEENDHRTASDAYWWLVDPLDGTKEFLKRNGEFTVNIALMTGTKPLLGVVYAPALDVLYYGDTEISEAYKVEANSERQRITSKANVPPAIVTSRSHKDEQTKQLLAAIGEHVEVSKGSSLKLCLVAEGKAMLYPRLAPTSLWDTAAADAVVTAAGGAVKRLDGELLSYNPVADILNPYFIVESANNTIDWQMHLR